MRIQKRSSAFANLRLAKENTTASCRCRFRRHGPTRGVAHVAHDPILEATPASVTERDNPILEANLEESGIADSDTARDDPPLETAA